MTDSERTKLAEDIAAKLHGQACPMGFSPNDAATLAAFADTLRQVKAAAIVVLVGAVLAGAGWLIRYGVTHREASAPPPATHAVTVWPGESAAD